MEYDASSPLRGDSPEGGSGDELIVGWRAVSKGVATNGEFWETERFLGVCLSIYHGETRKEITPFLYGLVAGHCQRDIKIHYIHFEPSFYVCWGGNG